MNSINTFSSISHEHYLVAKCLDNNDKKIALKNRKRFSQTSRSNYDVINHELFFKALCQLNKCPLSLNTFSTTCDTIHPSFILNKNNLEMVQNNRGTFHFWKLINENESSDIPQTSFTELFDPRNPFICSDCTEKYIVACSQRGNNDHPQESTIYVYHPETLENLKQFKDLLTQVYQVKVKDDLLFVVGECKQKKFKLFIFNLNDTEDQEPLYSILEVPFQRYWNRNYIDFNDNHLVYKHRHEIDTNRCLFEYTFYTLPLSSLNSNNKNLEDLWIKDDSSLQKQFIFPNGDHFIEVRSQNKTDLLWDVLKVKITAEGFKKEKIAKNINLIEDNYSNINISFFCDTILFSSNYHIYSYDLLSGSLSKIYNATKLYYKKEFFLSNPGNGNISPEQRNKIYHILLDNKDILYINEFKRTDI